jgi:hypothetical protein
MIGPRGELKKIGLVPLADEARAAVRERWDTKTAMTPEDLG